MTLERPMPPLRALCVFDSVYRHGSIRRAAEELSIDHTVAGRHIRALQQWLGVRLVDPSPKGIAFTPAGLSYAQQISQHLAQIADATSQLRGKPRRQLLVWCVPGFATHWLIARLPLFFDRHPRIDLSIRPTEGLPDFRSGEVAAKIHYGILQDPALTCTTISSPPVFAVASPAWIAANPHVRTPQDLTSAQLIHEETREAWRDWFAACGLEPGPLNGVRLWHANAAIEAAALGQGVILANGLIVESSLRTGALQPVVPDSHVLDSYVLVTARPQPENRALVAFTDWLVDSLRTSDVRAESR